MYLPITVWVSFVLFVFGFVLFCFLFCTYLHQHGITVNPDIQWGTRGIFFICQPSPFNGRSVLYDDIKSVRDGGSLNKA